MNAARECPVGTHGIDLFDAEFVAQPQEALAYLREQAPVVLDPRTGNWLVSRQQDIRHVLLNPDIFRPDNALTAVTKMCPAALRVLAGVGFHLPATLANNGEDHHLALRTLTAQFFTPGRIQACTSRVAQLAADAAQQAGAQLAEHEQIDLVESVAKDFPARVLIEVLGLTDIDVPQLKVWSIASLELFWGNVPPERQVDLAHLAAQFYSWLVMRVTHADPNGHDLFGVLAAARQADGRSLTLSEAVGIAYFLLVAGQETTSQLLALALHRLVNEPRWWQLIGQGDEAAAQDAAGQFVEEVLRLEPPVVTWRRTVAEATTLGQRDLPVGASVLLMLAGSGSDAEVFQDPQSFTPGRPRARRHLAFGVGQHFCLGAGLARMEAREFLRALARDLPPPRLMEQNPPMLGLLSFRAPRRLLVSADA